MLEGGPGSSVGIATDYGLDGPGSNLQSYMILYQQMNGYLPYTWWTLHPAVSAAGQTRYYTA